MVVQTANIGDAGKPEPATLGKETELRITEVNAVSLQKYFIPSHWGRMFVRVKTDDGIVGYGESGEDSRWRVGEALVDNWAKNVLVGSDPMDTEKILRKIWVEMRHFGRNGITMGTMSALDFALLDLKGKIMNVPVYELLGGKGQYKDVLRHSEAEERGSRDSRRGGPRSRGHGFQRPED